MRKLSARQEGILGFIRDFLSTRHYPPTIRDIQAGCKISSTSVVDYNLDVLERAGLLRRHAEVSRGIELLGGEALSEALVPVIGQIAAGQPVPVPDVETWDVAAAAETISVPREMTGGRAGIFALRVKGTSMIDALINDGDIVVMQAASTVENGQMAAVWFKNERETTLKKVYVEPGHVRLQPANSQMQSIYAAHDNVEIQGRVIGVIRRLD